MPSQGTSYAVAHDPRRRRFTVRAEDLEAELDYTVSDDIMTITHTMVPPPLGGRGIAAELMKAALEAARSAGWAVNPACSYAAAYLRKHPEQQ